ncbi:TolC family protein [Corallococcus exiguus]|uniref:TolC family protein n=1 Tax=Corallococcus TaxID=83461 RepID=UPI000ED1016B|nr:MULTISPECIES: TolC family protein [Corallococcus]NRD66441.1 TolC family protein [Corallococcus exiguus]RKI13284.1 TolC family protein [Corallococcus sp. AB030]
MPTVRRALFAAPLGACLCALAPDAFAQTPPAPSPAPATEAPASAFPKPPMPSADAAPLTLERAVELASQKNEAVLAAGQSAEAAQARVARARAFFLPTITAAGTYTRRLRESTREVGGQTVVLQKYNALGAVFSGRMALFDARGFPLYKAAKLESEAFKLDAVETRRQVSFSAANAFLVTLANQQVYQAAEQRLAYAKQSLADAQARASSGLASTNDVTRAELELATAHSNLAAALGTAETSRLELGYLLVEPVQGGLAPPEPLLADAIQPTPSLELLTEGATDRRPDILSARLRVRSLRETAKEPLARLLPSLGASAQYRLTNEAGLNGNVGDGFLALDLTWTLFDGGARYADRDERVANANVAELNTQAATRRVPVDIEQARVNLETARAALAQSEQAAKAARKNAAETGILYRQGLSTALTLADASLSLFEAEVALAQNRYGLGVALLGLRAAVGLNPLGKEP